MFLGGIRYLLPAIEAAHKNGYYVITVDYLPDNIAHRYSDEYYNASIIDKEKILGLARELRIDGILSYAVDPGVTTAAFVAEQLNLPFTCSYKAACILQNKALFRSFLASNNFNVPTAKSYSDVESVISDIDLFDFPVIVKPVDSAGSKGVTKVESPQTLINAVNHAFDYSVIKEIIIEEFLDIVGFQSSADCFAVNGNLSYADFSDQLFDKHAVNPFTPSIEIWPSSMEEKYKIELANELQRLFDLLEIRTGMFNVESRLCSNGKTYLMEVSPRAGGNRIAELQRIGTGIDLIDCEVRKAVGDNIIDIHAPRYDGFYVNDIIHSNCDGFFEGVQYNEIFKQKYFINDAIYPKIGDKIKAFKGANDAVGSVFLRFPNREELVDNLHSLHSNISVLVS